MSWGFIFDLHAELTASAWKHVLSTTPSAVVFPADWPGGAKHSLAGYFRLPPSCLTDTFKVILKYPVLTRSAVHQVTTSGDAVVVEHTTAIDRSNLEVGALLGPLL